MLIRGWIPVRIEEHQAVGTDKIQTTSTGFGGEKENKFLAFGVVEFVHELLSLVDVHRAVES